MRALLLLCINQQAKFEVCNFTDFKDTIAAKFKETGHVSLTTPIRELSIIESQALDIFYMHTNFGECRFSRSGDMIAGVEIAKWPRPFIGVVYHFSWDMI